MCVRIDDIQDCYVVSETSEEPLQSQPPVDIEGVGARHCRHLHPMGFAADRVHSLEVSFQGNGKPGFQGVHAEFGEFMR